jgi:hypothetical protein
MITELQNPVRASQLRRFLTESLAIEGVYRGPTDAETAATVEFLTRPLTLLSTVAVQGVYTPGRGLRVREGDDVRVGEYVAPAGGPWIEKELADLLGWQRLRVDPYLLHVEFEKLHPFLDGNGRTGRALWAHSMISLGRDPFDLPFLHCFYYQTLAHA